MPTADFPKGFVWGCATASCQVEGAWNETEGRVYLDRFFTHRTTSRTATPADVGLRSLPSLPRGRGPHEGTGTQKLPLQHRLAPHLP